MHNSFQFAVFGLGDTSYTKFNIVGKRLYKRLADIGAKPIYVLGDGNEQHPIGYEGELMPWLQGFWEVLLDMYPMPEGLSIVSDTILYPAEMCEC